MDTKKTRLRQQLKQKRLEMSDAEHTIKSREIVSNLKSVVEWQNVKSVHYFEPIKDLLEVDTSDLVTYLQDTYPDIRFFVPRKIDGVWEMVSAHGEPAPDTFDVVIVPMLGFDRQLHRIGYGGGYYDMFLAEQKTAQKIGVCFEDGLIDNVPAESHDIALDVIVTDKNVYRLA